ncbi:MAG: hypothetical protein ACP5EK_06720, partial [Thermoplasmatota archaeon]
YGLGAAFFVALVPTTIRFLGPSFLVPVALGLLLALVALILAEAEGGVRYPLLFALLLYTAVMHPPSAVALAVVLLCHAAMHPLDGRYREAGLLVLVTLVPFLIAYFVIPAQYFQQGIEALMGEKYTSRLAPIRLELQSMSVIVWGLFFLGGFLSLRRGRALQRGIVIATLAFMAVVLAYGEYGLGLPILYDRFFLYIFLLVALLAGRGLAEAGWGAEWALRRLAERVERLRGRKQMVVQGGSIAVVLILCMAAMVMALPAQRGEDYYTIISEEEFDRYRWVHDHIDEYRDEWHPFDYGAVDPFKAGPFSAVSGIYTVCSTFWPLYRDNLLSDMRSFLASNGSHPSFAEDWEIGVVMADMNSSLMHRVHEGVCLYYGTPPVADFTVAPGQPAAGEEVVFTSSASTPYGRLVDWQWSLEGKDMEGTITGLTLAEGQRLRAPLEMNGSFTIDLWLRPHFDHDDGRDHEWFRWAGNGGYVVLYKHSNSRLY